MEIDIENHINGVKDRINRIQQDIENQQQDQRDSTITEITIASSDDNPLDNSELNPLTLSMLQSPINKSSSSSSLDLQDHKDNTISTPKLKSTNKFSLISTENAKNNKTENQTESDSYSDSELSRLVASNKSKINNINQKLEFISDDEESSDISTPTAQANFSSSNSSNSSSFEDNIQNRFHPQNNLNEQTPKQREIEGAKNLIMNISDDSSDDTDESENSKPQSLDKQTFRKMEIERAKKLIMNISDDSSEDSDVNREILTKKRFFSSSDSDIDKMQIEIDAQKAEMEKTVTKDSEILPESAKIEGNPKDSFSSSENMNRNELKLNIDDISTSDSDDMPQFIPPVPDEIEIDLDFSKFSNKNSIVYNPNISTPQALEALDKNSLSSNKKSEAINYVLNVDDISSEELEIPQIDDDSNDEVILKRIIDHSTDDDDILRIVKDSNEVDLPKLARLPKTKNENDNIVQIMGNSDLNVIKHDDKLKNEIKNLGLNEQQSNSSLELMSALMSGSEIDSDVSLHDEIADSDESDVSFKQLIAAMDLNH